MLRDIAYTSHVRIERIEGPVRRAHLPAEESPVTFGVHSEIAEHYGVDPDRFPPHATTLDYVVAAAGGWLTGTFAGALEARGIELEEGDLVTEVSGEVIKDGQVLRIDRIEATYRLKVAEEKRDTIARVHSFHADHCPVARTIRDCVEIVTRFELV